MILNKNVDILVKLWSYKTTNGQNFLNDLTKNRFKLHYPKIILFRKLENLTGSLQN